MTTIGIGSGATWTVPAGVISAYVECIGGGGGGGNGAAGGTGVAGANGGATIGGNGGAGATGGAGGYGGGGGAYSAGTVALTPNSTVSINVGIGGAPHAHGGHTWFNGSSLGAASVSAEGGYYTSVGGRPSQGIGAIKYDGGACAGPGPGGGGAAGSTTGTAVGAAGGAGGYGGYGGAGGGAGGPHGAGIAASTTTGGYGDAYNTPPGTTGAAASAYAGGGAYGPGNPGGGAAGAGGINTSITGKPGGPGTNAGSGGAPGYYGGGGAGGAGGGGGGGGGGAFRTSTGGAGGGGGAAGAGSAGTQGLILVTYTALDAPTVSSCSPSTGPTAGGQAVTITGSGFTNVSSVNIGGAPLTSVSVPNANTITGITSAGAAGLYNVNVYLAANSILGTGTNLYTYAVPAAGGFNMPNTGIG